MRPEHQCLHCGGTLHLCPRFEREGVECWHCDNCDSRVCGAKAGELSQLGSAVFPLERALDVLRATQARQGVVGLEQELRYILDRMEATRKIIIKTLKQLNVPLIQAAPQKKRFIEQVVAEMNAQHDNLRLEGE